MKKSILIIENGSHYHVLDHLSNFYQNKNYEVALALNWKIDKIMITDLFKDYDKYKIIDIKSKNLFFLELLLKKNKYDYIHISTGAENTYRKFLPNIFFFFIYTLLFRKKIILQIRNSKYYLLTKNFKNYLKTNLKIYKKNFLYIFLIYSFSNFFRNLAYKNCKLCLFETCTQLIFFNKYTQYKYHKKNYFFYPLNLKKKILDTSSNNIKITIGIPGSYDPERRNYAILTNALNNLTTLEISKLKIIFIGNFNNANKKFLNFFTHKNIEIIIFNKFVTTSQYASVLNKCDYLLSLHQKKKHPFTFAGSGIIGDLNSCDKKIIISNIFDPFGELSSKAIYCDDLSKILKKLISGNHLGQSSTIKKKNNYIYKKYDYNNLL
jgi:hypothetical protein